MTKQLLSVLALGLFACGGTQSPDSQPATTGGGEQATGDVGDGTPADDEGKKRMTDDAGEFAVKDADKSSRPTQGKLKATETEAAVRFFVVDKESGPIPGIVIALTGPDGTKYYTEETDANGFAEVLLPIGKNYDLVYLSLGRRDIAAKVKVANEPNLNLKLTMRYKRVRYDFGKAPPDPEAAPEPPRFRLDGVEFDSNKAKLKPGSFERLDSIVEYMTHKTSARIEISGHTDNVGKKKTNLKLSQRRADAVKKYLVSKGIDASRIDAVGYGDAKPIASNDTKEGRQKNRRIEAVEK
jgi:outer membrane protein OmpA-like peptidoglycan-associated protein